MSTFIQVQYAFLQICKHAFLVAAKRQGRTYDSVAGINDHKRHANHIHLPLNKSQNTALEFRKNWQYWQLKIVVYLKRLLLKLCCISQAWLSHIFLDTSYMHAGSTMVEASICVKISNCSYWERRFSFTKNACKKWNKKKHNIYCFEVFF